MLSVLFKFLPWIVDFLQIPSLYFHCFFFHKQFNSPQTYFPAQILLWHVENEPFLNFPTNTSAPICLSPVAPSLISCLRKQNGRTFRFDIQPAGVCIRAMLVGIYPKQTCRWDRDAAREFAGFYLSVVRVLRPWEQFWWLQVHKSGSIGTLPVLVDRNESNLWLQTRVV